MDLAPDALAEHRTGHSIGACARPSMRRDFAVCLRASKQPSRTRRDVCRCRVVLLTLLAGAVFIAADPLTFTPLPSMAAARGIMATSALPRPHLLHPCLLGRTSMAAEGETIVAAAEETDVVRGVDNTPLFQELIVTNKSTSRVLMGATVAIFNKGERAADLILVDPGSKHELIKIAALVPEQFRASAQLLLRRRDRRLRMRMIQNFRPESDEEPELILVTKGTNTTKLGAALQSRFVDVLGQNRGRSVKLKLMGDQAAEIAILAIEKAQRLAYRDLAFVARYFEEETSSDVGAVGDGLATNSKQISMEIIVTAL